MCLLLLLTVGLSLLGSPQGHHVDPQFKHINPLDPSFKETLLKGQWFSVALASNVPARIQPGGDLLFFIHSIEVSDQDMQFHLHRRENGKCVPLQMTAYKTDKRFQYHLNYAGDNVVYLEEADPTSYVIFCTHNEMDGKETVLTELYSRTPNMSTDMQEQFEEYCESHGISAENIIDLTKTDRCLEARH